MLCSRSYFPRQNPTLFQKELQEISKSPENVRNSSILSFCFLVLGQVPELLNLKKKSWGVFQLRVLEASVCDRQA